MTMHLGRVLKTGVLLGILVAGGYFAWLVFGGGAAKEPSKPIEITDRRGRAIDVEVLGRAEDGARIRRTSDGREFTIALSRLNEASREKVRSALDSRGDAPVAKERQAGVKSLKKRLTFRQKQVEEIDFKLKDPNMDTARRRGLEREREKLVYKIEELRRRIKRAGGDPGEAIARLEATPSEDRERDGGKLSSEDASGGNARLLDDLKNFVEGRDEP